MSEVIRVQSQVSHAHNKLDIGKTFKVLIEGDSKKSDQEWKGRNTQNKMIIFPKVGNHKPGDYVYVTVESVTSATLRGQMVTVDEPVTA